MSNIKLVPMWEALKNDKRLSASQQKTVRKILVSLRIPYKTGFGPWAKRPALNFNINGMTQNQVNKEVYRRLGGGRAASNNNVFHNTMQTFNNPLYTNNNVNAARQHLESFGNR